MSAIKVLYTGTGSNTIYIGGTLSTVRISNGFSLPQTDGTPNQFLKTDGFGNIIWSNVIGGSNGVTASGTASYVSKFTGLNTLGNSLIRDDGTNIYTSPVNSSVNIVFGGSLCEFI